MEIKGNNNNVVINSNNNASPPEKKKTRITLVTILTIISLALAIYNDVHGHIASFFTEERSSPNNNKSLDYENATFGNNSKQRTD